MDDLERTRQSWNQATENHNRHKGDQAARMLAGEDWLFPEELALLGPLQGKDLVHLQCNAGQDSLCLARRGATVLGVDLSDHAIDVAKQLSQQTQIPARFVRSDLQSWFDETREHFDLAFASYGATGWLPDIDAWARGVHRVLRPGGALVYVEFHPVAWSVGPDGQLSGDDYFQQAPFHEPVGDYVAMSGVGLAAADALPPGSNDIPATSYQHGLAQVLQAIIAAGLVLERVQEYPYSNGCRLRPQLVPADGRRWVWPDGTARVPLMYGLRARKP